MKKFRFRQFQVYQDAIQFRQELKKLSKVRFSKDEQYCLTSQMWRALDSIVLNIAEGSDRSTDKDFANFLNMAHTSLNEVVACLDLALNDKYIADAEHMEYLNKAEEMANQLTAFRRKLLHDSKK
ncbi:MAG: four helix bundle protein [Candidatus Gracilibacteria bacterium]|nr:four helix bundle protein [Candidatus Gracilibacteria bacterium]